MGKQDLIAERALSLVGCGYVYGATGWICTQARLNQQARQYPLYAPMILRYGPRWIGRRCFDCAQLTRAAAQAAGVSLPSGASSQWRDARAWKERGAIDALPDEPGLFLYTQKGGRMTHAGVSVGGGWEVDARGHAYGVVRRRIADTSFTHWARLAVGEDAGTGESAQPQTPAVRTLRRGMTGEDVRMLQELINKAAAKYPSIPVLAVDGIFGPATDAAVRFIQQNNGYDADGIVGPLTWNTIVLLGR